MSIPGIPTGGTFRVPGCKDNRLDVYKRQLPCPSVRIYGQPVGRDSGVPAAGAVLQMVAGEAQTGAVGIYLA